MAWVNIVDYLDQFVVSWGDIGFNPADPQYPGPRSFSLVNDEFVLDRPTWSGAYRSRLMVSKRGDATVNYSDIRIRTLGYHEYHASGNTGNFYPSGVILQYGQEARDTEVVQNNFDYPAVAMDPSTVAFSEFVTEGAPYGIGFQTAGESFNYETFYADGAFVIELNIGDDPEPPSDCFWTDIVGASQDCGGGLPPTDLQPIRDYYLSADNGTVAVRWQQCDDEGSNCWPDYYNYDSFFGIYLDVSQWKVVGGVRSDYTSSGSYRVEATIHIYRHPRNTNFSQMGSDWSNPPSFATFVTTLVVTDMELTPGTNGGIRDLVVGNVDGMPDVDPQYQYFLDVTYTIYGAGGDVLGSGFGGGAVFDPTGEIAPVPIKQSITVEPVGRDAYSARLKGMTVGLVSNRETSDVLLYTVGYWDGIMEDLACGDYPVSVEGQPVQDAYAACS